uniref:Major facilitator superfamily (MFS) profile domain-containing protein n=2 Tax=Glossina morsitans morsitans TaxID=37546 RepID=A0A1B0GEM0_GLOMM
MSNSNNSAKSRSTDVKYFVTQEGFSEEIEPSNLFHKFNGFLVSFMMRNDINIALVAMTAENSTQLTGIFQTNENATLSSALASADTFDWSPTVKSVITGSFFVCYVLSQVVGGVAAQRFGTKRVFGWSQFATAFGSLCIPFAADLHYTVVIVIRCIQGFASGLTWPAMYAVVGYWIPLSERSRFMSSFQGFSIGIGLTYVICGFIIDNFSWRYAFFTTGSLGMLWCFLWYMLAYNTPHEHPRITDEELEYIEMNIGVEVKETVGTKVPWKCIFTSLPVWAIGITTFGRIWIHYVFIVYGPSFMTNILKFPLQTNGFLSGMPFICSYLSSVVFCCIADKMVLKEVMSLTNIRKLFTAFSQIIPGILIFSIGYINNIVVLLIIWFIAVTYITASYAGAMANIVDIAPNLAGQVLAFCQTIHMPASFLSPLAGGFIVTSEGSIEEWRILFGTSSVISIVTYSIYQIYGTATIQKWNYLSTSNSNSSEENNILNNKDTEDNIPIDDV